MVTRGWGFCHYVLISNILEVVRSISHFRSVYLFEIVFDLHTFLDMTASTRSLNAINLN